MYFVLGSCLLTWFDSVFQLGLMRFDQYSLALDKRLRSPHGRTNHRNWLLVNLGDILHLAKGPPHLSCSTFRWNTCWSPVLASARLHSECTNCPLPAGISRSQRIHPSIPLQWIAPRRNSKICSYTPNPELSQLLGVNLKSWKELRVPMYIL